VDALLVPIGLGCLLALVTALGVVVARRPVHGAMALLGHSLALAGLYLMLAAELVAMGQILIYSGAIVVLFLFVVALLPSGGSEGAPSVGRVGTAAIGAGATLLALAAAVGTVSLRAAGAPPVGVEAVRTVGRSLFGPLLVPFELTAPLLLVAIVGAVTIWRRQESPRHLSVPSEPRADGVAAVPERRAADPAEVGR
jgi:NADH-quinone oxidoreductase subunit J